MKTAGGHKTEGETSSGEFGWTFTIVARDGRGDDMVPVPHGAGG